MSKVPHDPRGTFAVASRLDVRPPAAASQVLAMLTAATDGPDDPSRYIVDRMVAAMPDGTAKTIASASAPFVAAYLNDKLAEVAPRFVAGIDGMVSGLNRIATHFGTTEALRVDAFGTAVRTLTGLRFELAAVPVDLAFADHGVADPSTTTRVSIDEFGHVTIASHALRLQYGVLLRLGLDNAVIPGIAPTAHDLAGALRALVDCTRLGQLVADHVGIGSATLYRTACTAGLVAIATEIDDRIAAIDAMPIDLALAGTADGIDLDGDGTMDAISAGTWTGMLGPDPIGAATFAGTKAP